MPLTAIDLPRSLGGANSNSSWSLTSNLNYRPSPRRILVWKAILEPVYIVLWATSRFHIPHEDIVLCKYGSLGGAIHGMVNNFVMLYQKMWRIGVSYNYIISKRISFKLEGLKEVNVSKRFIRLKFSNIFFTCNRTGSFNKLASFVMSVTPRPPTIASNAIESLLTK